jgi:hypothetical protein
MDDNQADQALRKSSGPAMNSRRSLIVLLILAALPLVGAGWQRRLARDRDHRRYPPTLVSSSQLTTTEPGCISRLRAGTTAVRIRTSPVVLLDAGTPGFPAQWAGFSRPSPSSLPSFPTIVPDSAGATRGRTTPLTLGTRPTV